MKSMTYTNIIIFTNLRRIRVIHAYGVDNSKIKTKEGKMKTAILKTVLAVVILSAGIKVFADEVSVENGGENLALNNSCTTTNGDSLLVYHQPHQQFTGKAVIEVTQNGQKKTYEGAFSKQKGALIGKINYEFPLQSFVNLEIVTYYFTSGTCNRRICNEPAPITPKVKAQLKIDEQDEIIFNCN